MGEAIIKLKIMPSSPEVNLKEIEEKVLVLIEENNGKGCQFQEEPIAFGLKAIIALFQIDESQELDFVETKISKIENINSVQIIDMRRAFG